MVLPPRRGAQIKKMMREPCDIHMSRMKQYEYFVFLRQN